MSAPTIPAGIPKEDLPFVSIQPGPPLKDKHGEIEPDAIVVDVRTGKPIEGKKK